jgi:hypothetical protein
MRCLQLFIASAFVLGQAAITQAISFATRVREIAGEAMASYELYLSTAG